MSNTKQDNTKKTNAKKINESKIAQALLEIQAIHLKPTDPFTWASGLKSPIYCDNRLVMSYPKVRTFIIDCFVDLIKTHYPEVEVIAGTATAGIPHAAWIAEKMNLPMIYVRSSAKSHGRGNQIEGKLNPKQKVVLVEDLISTGGSVLEAYQAIEKAGGEVLGVAAIFTYQLEKGLANFAKANVQLETLSNYNALIETAIELGSINDTELELLKKWRQNPENWQ